MKFKTVIIFIIVGVLLTMGMFSFMKRQKPESVIYRLVWFEIQIAPASYRFAIMPEQPILVGYEGEDGEKGATMLIRYEHVPNVYERTVERVDALVKKSGILSLAPTSPEQAFADTAMTEQSIHIRIAYADNTRWAGVYGVDEIPEGVATLVHETKALARQIMREQSGETIDGEKAQAFLDPEKNAAQKDAPSVIVKIIVLQSGKITANGREVTLAELERILDELKRNNGGVWYFREAPEQEPEQFLVTTIERVLDAITSRELPVRLQPQEY